MKIYIEPLEYVLGPMSPAFGIQRTFQSADAAAAFVVDVEKESNADKTSFSVRVYGSDGIWRHQFIGDGDECRTYLKDLK